MSVLAQALLALVRSHLVSLMLLSVRHNYYFLKVFLFANLGNESLGWLESGDVVSGDDDGGVLRDVACGLLRAGLDGKATESTEINVLAVGQGVLYTLHEAFHYTLYLYSFDAGTFGNFIDDFSFGHDIYFFNIIGSSLF